jgi:hypothetical protein
MEDQIISREDKIALFAKLVATNPLAVLKGDTIPYTSMNGNMYSYFSKEGVLALRLPEKERREFLEKYNTTLMEAYGIVQKEYVVVPDSLLQNTDELKPWFESSYIYVGLMKPKPTKGKKKG